MARTTTARSASPPGGTVSWAGTSTCAFGAAWGSTPTCHAPAPPPASVTRSSRPALADRRRPNESDAGSVKIFGSAAPGSDTSPAPSSSTDASAVRAVSPQAGPAVDISADFTCRGVHPGCSCRSSAAEPDTCGVAMLVPSKTANGEPANSGSVDESTWPPGAARSGLRSCAKAVGPADEKLVTTPPRPVASSSGVVPSRTGARPPVPPRYARSLAPSRSLTITAGSGSSSGSGFASPGRLST